MTDPSPFVEALTLTGTFTVIISVLCLAISKLPADGVPPRRRPDGPGPSPTGVTPIAGHAAPRDGSGPLFHPAGLRRRKPLKRTRMKRTRAKPQRRTQLRAVSDRRRDRDKVYPSSRTAIYERAEGLCEARVDGVCDHQGYQVHHLAGRGGAEPHRLENLLLVCGPCHDWIGANPAKSYELGLMVRRNTGGAA